MKNTNYKYLLVVVLSFLGGGNWAYAQEATTKAVAKSTAFSFGELLIVAAFLVIIFAFLTVWKVMRTMLKSQQMQLMKEQGTPITEEMKEGVSFWKKLTDAVPLEHEEDVMLDHDYDGIRELDNKLPPWWVALFYITIAWAVVYIGYFHVLKLGPLQAEEFEIKMQQAEEQVSAHLATLGAQVDENTAEKKTDEASLAAGKKVFELKCAACHRADGGGLVGPNLTDEYWLHGGDIKSIFKTIKYGVPSTAMAPWEKQLSPLEIEETASYVMSLKGTNPPDPKAPQGEKE